MFRRFKVLIVAAILYAKHCPDFRELADAHRPYLLEQGVAESKRLVDFVEKEKCK